MVETDAEHTVLHQNYERRRRFEELKLNDIFEFIGSREKAPLVKGVKYCLVADIFMRHIEESHPYGPKGWTSQDGDLQCYTPAIDRYMLVLRSCDSDGALLDEPAITVEYDCSIQGMSRTRSDLGWDIALTNPPARASKKKGAKPVCLNVLLKLDPAMNEMSWDAFRLTKPPFSIAIDGYVNEGPKFDALGPWACMNHHEGVPRLETRATCAQAFMAIRQGLFATFCDANGPRMEIWANDCDQDVCFTVFLLQHPELVTPHAHPGLERLVQIVDALDTTGGACLPPTSLADFERLAWIFEPYLKFRQEGGLQHREAEVFYRIVYAVIDRIGECVDGRGGSLPIDTRYERVGGGTAWAMIREIGTHSRHQAFADGIRAYVSVTDRQDGLWNYTIGRMSEYVPFDVPNLLNMFRSSELDPRHTWGGGTTIGGCSRVHGSSLSPDAITDIIERHLKQ